LNNLIEIKGNIHLFYAFNQLTEVKPKLMNVTCDLPDIWMLNMQCQAQVCSADHEGFCFHASPVSPAVVLASFGPLSTSLQLLAPQRISCAVLVVKIVPALWQERLTEQPQSQKGCGYCVSASCRLIPHGAGSPLWLALCGTVWAPRENGTAGYSTCSGVLVTICIVAESILHITKFTSTELNLISEN